MTDRERIFQAANQCGKTEAMRLELESYLQLPVRIDPGGPDHGTIFATRRITPSPAGLASSETEVRAMIDRGDIEMSRIAQPAIEAIARKIDRQLREAAEESREAIERAMIYSSATVGVAPDRERPVLTWERVREIVDRIQADPLVVYPSWEMGGDGEIYGRGRYTDCNPRIEMVRASREFEAFLRRAARRGAPPPAVEGQEDLLAAQAAEAVDLHVEPALTPQQRRESWDGFLKRSAEALGQGEGNGR